MVPFSIHVWYKNNHSVVSFKALTPNDMTVFANASGNKAIAQFFLVCTKKLIDHYKEFSVVGIEYEAVGRKKSSAQRSYNGTIYTTSPSTS